MKIKIKELVLGILVIALGLINLWLWQKTIPLILQANFTYYQNFVWAFAGLIATGAVMGLAMIMVSSRWFIYTIGFIEAGVAIFFISITNDLPGYVAAAGLILALAFVAWGIHGVRKETNRAPDFSLYKSLKAGLPLFFTASALLISLFYLAEIKNDQGFSAILPKPLWGYMLEKFSGPLQGPTGLPKFNPNETIDQALNNFAQNQLKTESSSKLIPGEYLQNLIKQEKNELANKFGVALRGNENIKDVFYNTLAEKFAKFAGPYQKFLPLISVLAFFLTFKVLTVPIFYLAVLLAWVLLKFMKLAKITSKEKVSIEVERLKI